MQYKCPQCGYTSEQAGNCPTCNVPLTEVKAEQQPAAPQEPAQTQPSENQNQ